MSTDHENNNNQTTQAINDLRSGLLIGLAIALCAFALVIQNRNDPRLQVLSLVFAAILVVIIAKARDAIRWFKSTSYEVEAELKRQKKLD